MAYDAAARILVVAVVAQQGEIRLWCVSPEKISWLTPAAIRQHNPRHSV